MAAASARPTSAGIARLGVQFARHMGFRVAGIDRGANKAPLAAQLGAHHYIDSGAEDPAAALQALGGGPASS
jgi:D-arabinose 1-dehydrogenase-like Zn-dependent alcohol dehydrogenase